MKSLVKTTTYLRYNIRYCCKDVNIRDFREYLETLGHLTLLFYPQSGLIFTNRNNIRTNAQVRSRNHFWCGKLVSITYSECVSVVFVTQPAINMRRIILLSMACLAVPHFSTLSHKWFTEKSYWIKMGVLIFSSTYVQDTSHFKEFSRYIIINIHRCSCKLHVIRVEF